MAAAIARRCSFLSRVVRDHECIAACTPNRIQGWRRGNGKPEYHPLSQVKDPCAPLVTWRSCLVSSSSPSSQPPYFTPGHVTLDEILSDTAFHTLSGFYIPRYSLFASGCGSNLLPFTAGASAFTSGFLEVYSTLFSILFHRLATKIQTTIVAL